MEECKIVMVVMETDLKKFFSAIECSPKEFLFERYGANKFRIVTSGTLDEAKRFCRSLNKTDSFYTITVFSNNYEMEKILVS